MNEIRDILNELKWRKNKNLEDVKIWYIHRGAPNNTRILSGKDIISIDKTFIEIKETMIPHHRIFKICLHDTILFQRERKDVI
jgi:uncharacterized protein